MHRDAIDQNALKTLYGEEQELIDDMLDLYREKSGKAIDNLERALKEGVAADIQMAAHRIKGVLGSIGAQRGAAAALALEKAAATGSTDNAAALGEALRTELRAVDDELKVTR